jgi:son of sevenless-like protein
MTLQLATSDGSQQEIMPAASTTIHTSSVHITKPTNHVRHTSSSSTTLLLSSGASSSSLGVSTSSWSSSQFHSPSSPDTDVYVSESDEHLNASGDYVLAMHDYEADKQNTTCLSFKAGQVIRVYNRDTSGWWDGELEGRRGWFPSNYVGEDITAAADEVSPTKQVSVQHGPNLVG